MSFQVEITQKGNGTCLVAARAANERYGSDDSLRAAPYRNVAAFLHVLRAADYDDQTRAAIEQAATQAEGRPEMAIVCEVRDLGRQQLAKIGLN